jgi:hypothetical protein
MKTSLINKFASFLHYHFGKERIDWLQLLGTSHREKNKKEKLYDDISDVRLL